jgi:hypothetical protein
VCKTGVGDTPYFGVSCGVITEYEDWYLLNSTWIRVKDGNFLTSGGDSGATVVDPIAAGGHKLYGLAAGYWSTPPYDSYWSIPADIELDMNLWFCLNASCL